MTLPWVTCVCATYGRFSSMREALACFLLQDYPNKKLIILNDAEKPLLVGGDDKNIVVRNEKKMFANLGAKRQALLEMADTELVSHWDDDDIYLPWHLTRSIEALQRTGAECVKTGGAWYMKGSFAADGGEAKPSVTGIAHNNFEGTMIFKREAAKTRGGYPPMHSGQAKALMDAFSRAKKLHTTPDSEPLPGSAGPALQVKFSEMTYIYRWAQRGVGHISAFGNKGNSLQRFMETNKDFGDGSALTPSKLTGYWDALDAGTAKLIRAEDHARLMSRLQPYRAG